MSQDTTTITLRPDGTVQPGTWTTVGAANPHTAVSDGLDTSYVQLVQRCRVETQKLILSVPDLDTILPEGGKIFSVGTRIRIQTVAYPAPQPRCIGWFRHRRHQGIITTIVEAIVEVLFSWLCPRPTPSQPTVSFVDKDLDYSTTDGDGQPWTLDSFNAFEVVLGREDSANNPLRISEVFVDVTYVLPGDVTVTNPTGTVTDTDPTGVETNTVRPTVRWDFTSPQNDPQQAFRVAIYSDAQVQAEGFEPFVSTPTDGTNGFVFSEAQQWTGNVDLVNGVWWAFVQAQPFWTGPGEFVTNISSISWIQAVAAAPVASLLAATFEPGFNRIRLDATPSVADPVTDKLAFWVSRDGGGTWATVRGAALVDADGMNTVTVYDHAAPLNVASIYRVLAYRFVDTIPFPAEDYSNQLSATPVTTKVWLRDPFNPTLDTVLPVAYLGDKATIQQAQGVFPVISGGNKVNKVVVNGPVYGKEGTLELVFTKRDPEDYWAAFVAIMTTRHTLLLQWPNGEQQYIKFGAGSTGSDLTYQWDISLGAQPKRRYTTLEVSYTEVDEPPAAA